jgi:hypothetical protein
MFSLTSSGITQMQGRDPSARLSRRATPSIKIIGSAAVALLASANTFANAAENPREWLRSTMPVPSSWGSIHRDAVIAPASAASLEACPNGIKCIWRRAHEAHVPRRGSSAVRQLSQSAS